MDLKDYKRVSSGSEFRDVVQTSDTEPRYRSNGHQLEFTRLNSDHMVLSERREFTGDFYVEATINSKIDDTTQMLFMDDTGVLGEIRPYTLGRVRFRVASGTTYYSATNILPINTTYNLKVERVGSDVNVYVDGVLEDTFTADSSSIGVKNIGVKGTFSFEGDIYSININGETFTPTNINSNAQIVGSNGTIAQVNSSAADPINYILGTVFQKRGFALALNSGNSEYLLFNDPISFDSDNSIEFVFYPTLFNSFANYILSTSTDTQGARISFDSSAIFLAGNNGLTQNFNGFTIAPNQINTIKIESTNSDITITLNGVSQTQAKAGSGYVFDSVNNRGGDSIYFRSLDIYSISGYPLTRGLGVEVIGSNGTTAEIKTSAANPQQRVNFGMWQKNGNALKLNASNSDYLEFDDFTFENGEVISVNVKDYNLTNIIYVFGNSLEGNTYLILSSSTVQIRKGSNITTFNHSETILNSLILSKNTNNLTVIINGNTLPSQSVSDDFVFNQFNERGVLGLKSTITLNSFELGSETFLFREGNGLTTTSESGNTTATINTSAANPTEYINTYVWNKDNNKFIDYKV